MKFKIAVASMIGPVLSSRFAHFRHDRTGPVGVHYGKPPGLHHLLGAVLLHFHHLLVLPRYVRRSSVGRRKRRGRIELWKLWLWRPVCLRCALDCWSAEQLHFQFVRLFEW
jgi:hypothetical protein